MAQGSTGHLLDRRTGGWKDAQSWPRALCNQVYPSMGKRAGRRLPAHSTLPGGGSKAAKPCPPVHTTGRPSALCALGHRLALPAGPPHTESPVRSQPPAPTPAAAEPAPATGQSRSHLLSQVRFFPKVTGSVQNPPPRAHHWCWPMLLSELASFWPREFAWWGPRRRQPGGTQDPVVNHGPWRVHGTLWWWPEEKAELATAPSPRPRVLVQSTLLLLPMRLWGTGQMLWGPIKNLYSPQTRG